MRSYFNVKAEEYSSWKLTAAYCSEASVDLRRIIYDYEKMIGIDCKSSEKIVGRKLHTDL